MAEHTRRRKSATAVAVLAALAVVRVILALSQTDRPRDASPGGQATCDIRPADDETAITAAIAGCRDGSTVRFPPGEVYHQASEIKVERRVDITIDGNGSSFVSTAPNSDQLNPNWILIDGVNVVLENMTVEGNFKMGGPRSFERMQEQFPSGNHFNGGVMVYGGDGVTVRDVTIRDTFGDGAFAGPSGILAGGAGPNAGLPRNVRFQRLDITRTARQGVAFTGGVGLWLEDSKIADAWYLGVDLEIDVPGQLLQDVHILRNTFDGSFFGAVALPWPGDGRTVHGIEIRGNRTLAPPDNCGPQISINAHPDQTVPVSSIVTEQNDLLTLSRGIIYRSVTSGSIRENRIEKRPAPFACGDPEEAPVIVPRSPDVVVEGNTAVNY